MIPRNFNLKLSMYYWIDENLETCHISSQMLFAIVRYLKNKKNKSFRIKKEEENNNIFWWLFIWKGVSAIILFCYFFKIKFSCSMNYYISWVLMDSIRILKKMWQTSRGWRIGLLKHEERVKSPWGTHNFMKSSSFENYLQFMP